MIEEEGDRNLQLHIPPQFGIFIHAPSVLGACWKWDAIENSSIRFFGESMMNVSAACDPLIDHEM